MSRDIKAGGAYVELLLRKKKFQAGLAKAGKMLRTFAKGAALAGAAVGGAAVGGIALGIRQFIRMGDELDKMSQRTGVTVERLSELKHAAGQSGAAVQDLEKGFAGLSRSLFDARRGSKEATAALAAAGLTLKDLEGLSPDEQMAKVADGLQRITDESTKGAVAQRIFGRAGRQLLPMLRNGSAGIAGLSKEARNLGIAMSGDSAKGAARLLDMLSILGGQGKVLLFELGAAAGPFLEEVLTAVSQYASHTIGKVREAGAFIAANAGVVFEWISQTWQAVYDFTAPIIGDLRAVVLDGFSAVVGITSWAFSGISTTVAAAWKSVTGQTGGAMAWIQETVSSGLSIVSFAFREWQILMETAAVSAQLSVVRWGNQVVYYFTEVIPALLSWFAENWREVFLDAANITATVATNIGKNLQSLWDGIVSLFAGEGFEFEWTPLTEGFKSAIKELPKIAEREMGPLETQLQEDLNRLAEQMVGGFEEHREGFRQRSAELEPINPFEAPGYDPRDPPEIPKFDFAAIEGSFGEIKRQILVSFSAAALAGQTAATADPQLDELKRQSRYLKTISRHGHGRLGP